ncbi:MAG TPA: hypothetical protein VMS22_15810 [Candidatus Eisenbacteria bacterium]|nr:hypothetical protein [Candidatus Eisenbacteria bacterium]
MWAFPEPVPLLLPWGWLLWTAPTSVPLAAFALIAIGGLAAWRVGPGEGLGRVWAVVLAWVVAGVVVALPPRVLVHGHVLELPQALVARWTPIYEALRVPERIGVSALVGLALLVGLAFAACERLVRRWAPALPAAGVGLVLALLAGLACYDGYVNARGIPYMRGNPPIPATFPLFEAPVEVPEVIEALRGAGPTIDVPAWPPRGAASAGLHARATYRAIQHGRPILNGYSGYWPAGFPERMAVATQLPGPAALATLRNTTGLSTVVVRLDELRPRMLQAWVLAAAHPERSGLRLVAHTPSVLVLSVAPDSERR